MYACIYKLIFAFLMHSVEVEKNKMEVNRLRDLQIALLFQPLIRHNYVNLGSYKLEANQLCQENMASTSALMPRVLPSSLIPRKNSPGDQVDQYLNLEDWMPVPTAVSNWTFSLLLFTFLYFFRDNFTNGHVILSESKFN